MSDVRRPFFRIPSDATILRRGAIYSLFSVAVIFACGRRAQITPSAIKRVAVRKIDDQTRRQWEQQTLQRNRMTFPISAEPIVDRTCGPYARRMARPRRTEMRMPFPHIDERSRIGINDHHVSSSKLDPCVVSTCANPRAHAAFLHAPRPISECPGTLRPPGLVRATRTGRRCRP